MLAEVLQMLVEKELQLSYHMGSEAVAVNKICTMKPENEISLTCFVTTQRKENDHGKC